MTDADADAVAFTQQVTQHLARMTEANAENISRAASLVVEVGQSGNVLYAAGAGHSLGGVLELFFRAGGLAYASPIWHPSIFPLHGASESTQAERKAGLGFQTAKTSGIGSGDALVVFSNSGINPYPVEISEHARSVGAPVVAITSVAASRAAPLRGTKRLLDIADIVLDTGVPPGDVSWPVGSAQVAPLSSMANVHLWNLVMIRALRADPQLPTWRSANSGDSEEPNDLLKRRYRALIPAM